MENASHPSVQTTQLRVAKRDRLDFIDALRGSALGGIMVLHSIEHWNFMVYPSHPARWLQVLDTWPLSLGFGLFHGKAYGVFALLFGFSFFLILDSWTQRGIPFTGRFLWRLMLLGSFGYLHGVIYWGDFLVIIALLGVLLLMLHHLATRILAWISAVLLLQVSYLWDECQFFFSSSYHPMSPYHAANIVNQLNQVYAHGSFLDVVRSIIGEGQLARFWWFIDNGRYTQMLGLFLLGFLLGRSRSLETRSRRVALARRVLFCSVIGTFGVVAARYFCAAGAHSTT